MTKTVMGGVFGGTMAVCVGIRPITDDEGMRLVRIVRRGSGSVVTWRRVQMLLLSAQGMPVGRIAEVTFTSPDRVRDVLHNFNPDGVRLPVSPLCGMAALPQVGFLCCAR